MDETEILERRVNRKASQHAARPSMLVQNPDFPLGPDDTTMVNGKDNPYNNDMSSYDDSYSGSDLDGESFASETSDGILSPAEIEKNEKNIIALKEHQRVFRARIFVLVLLMITAVSNAVIVYFLTYNMEYDDYQSHYDEIVNEIHKVSKENIRLAFRSMDAMSVALTTRVLDNPSGGGDYWPFVTFPNFPELGEDARNVSGAIQITFAPIVDEAERKRWEEYTVYNQEWLISEEHTEYYRRRRLRNFVAASYNTSSPSIEGTEQQQSPAYSSLAADVLDLEELRYTALKHSELEINPLSSEEEDVSAADSHPLAPLQYQRRQHEDHNFRGVTPVRIHPAPTREERLTPGKQYAPVWQMSPPPYYRGIVNYDLYAEETFQRLSQMVNETRKAVISNLLNDDLVELLMEDPSAQHNPFSQHYGDADHRHGKKYPPCSVLVQPVWDDLGIYYPTLIGYLIALVPWEAYLVDTFRPGSEESMLARYEEANCDSDSMLNYQLRGGEKVVYTGNEETFRGSDNFDYTMKSEMYINTQPASPIQVSLLVEPNSTIVTEGNETEVPQPADCDIVLQLFPSFEMKSQYVTNWPIYYAMMICTTFVLLSMAFFIYDLVAERRRGRVMAVAEKTGRIVTDLFPGQFADQLIAEDKQKEKDAKKKKKKKVVIEEAPKRQLRKFMNSKKGKDKAPAMDGSGQQHALGYGSAHPGGEGDNPLFLAQSKPIADLFPETTVLFADIAGFTAWSSVREPSQVFTLLETVYQNFDYLAKQYGIFKIETIGDCYVAVCGLPEPREDHAVAMSRFALACMQKMKTLVSALEVTLGPDTGDLTMRFGLHSGPVTAGVLRGERARFQLFGDTVNTAARMESTGLRDKIQISQECADLLTEAGKAHWFTKRDRLVQAKGKGELQTYWLNSSVVRRTSMDHRRQSMEHRRRHSMSGARASSNRGGLGDSTKSSTFMSTSVPVQRSNSRNLIVQDSERLLGPLNGSSDGDSGRIPSLESQRALLNVSMLSKKQQRLVDWNCELIQQIVRQIVARRNFLRNTSKPIHIPFNTIKELPTIGGMMIKQGTSTMPLDEVVEVINLPEFDVAAYHANTDAKHIKLDPSVIAQLRKYVANLASRYRDNPFHNFEHASHVTMSVSKLLTRIVAPDLASINDRHDNNDISSSLHLTNDMKDLHDHTYGITSDPLTQLAVVMSALIHDVDHPGVPNNVLAKEEPDLAVKYRNKSIAEQNSVDIAWELFMDEDFKGLRETICPEYTELRRFRQIIVSSVLATDIFDPELSSLRKARWAKAFPPEAPVSPIDEVGDRRSIIMPRTSLAFKDPRASLQAGLSGRNLGGFHAHNTRHDINRKATIVIEHLIQASDVSHTMQHWHIYQKWNECLFKEMYQAYKDGRTEKDPSEGWYKGEIWFFDNYVIPLAKKLKECGVFGVSSDEYLDYATANRNEWEEKGEAIVADFIYKYKDARGRIEKSELGYG